MPSLLSPFRPLYWTRHSRNKMRYYGFSEARVRRVLHSPKRIEEGIAPKTIAFMQPAGNEKHPYEIWVMVQDEKRRRKVISAWRYPGRTKLGKPLPEDFIKELQTIIGQAIR